MAPPSRYGYLHRITYHGTPPACIQPTHRQQQSKAYMAIIQKQKRRSSKTWPKCLSVFIVLVFCFAVFQDPDLFTSDDNEQQPNNKVRARQKLVSEIDPNVPPARLKQESPSRPVVACKDEKKTKPSSSSSTKERDFLEIAIKTGTDKVEGYGQLPQCLKDPKKCIRGESEREVCRPWGHFYDTIYNKWLKKYSTDDDAESIQFLEIGYYTGRGFDAYSRFMPRAEGHSMEISCNDDPKIWHQKWGNFAAKNPQYESLREARRLHCGNANSYEFLHKVWIKEMKRLNAPPLKLVIEDASHNSEHMATSLFFWLPRIEPGGILVVEDVQPLNGPNKFRTHILPQVIKDLHWCGNKLKEITDTRCFPGIQPLLAGVHCEMHICVFERNDTPSIEPDMKNSMTPPNAFENAQKCLFGPH